MNLNKVQVIGRLTKQPEVRITPTGVQVASFSVATNRSWIDKIGQKQEETEFHNIVAFGKLAEIIAKWFAKGDEIYIEGRLKTNSWQDQSGVKKYKTDIIAEKFDFGQKVKKNQENYQQVRNVQEYKPVDNSQSTSPTASQDIYYETPVSSNDEIDINNIPF